MKLVSYVRSSINIIKQLQLNPAFFKCPDSQKWSDSLIYDWRNKDV